MIYIMYYISYNFIILKIIAKKLLKLQKLHASKLIIIIINIIKIIKNVSF